MADSLNLRVHADDLQKDLKRLDKQTERATMWGLREVSRRFRAEAKRRAPVYKGKDAVKRAKKGEKVDHANNRPVSGLLKASISGSKQLKKHGRGEYSLVSGPRGLRVHLYAAKAEAKHGFIRGAYDATMPEASALMGKGWERAMRSVR